MHAFAPSLHVGCCLPLSPSLWLDPLPPSLASIGGEHENIGKMARGALKNADMVLEYRIPDPEAAKKTQGSVWMLILSTLAMLTLAGTLAGGGCAIDAKWKTNEKGYGLTALVMFDDEGRAWPVALMVHNVEHYWTTRWLKEAVQRCMPCTRPTCDCLYTTRALPRGGFCLDRRCKAYPSTELAFVMCDKLASQVKAFRNNAFGKTTVLLCQFHVFQAMLDKYNELKIRDFVVLSVLVWGVKMIRQSRTAGIAKARFVLFSRLLPSVIKDRSICSAVLTYLSTFWMSARWLLTWIDGGRILKGIYTTVTTGNSVERLWIDVETHMCKNKMFKRLDDQITAITGPIPLFPPLCPSVAIIRPLLPYIYRCQARIHLWLPSPGRIQQCR